MINPSESCPLLLPFMCILQIFQADEIWGRVPSHEKEKIKHPRMSSMNSKALKNSFAFDNFKIFFPRTGSLWRGTWIKSLYEISWLPHKFLMMGENNSLTSREEFNKRWYVSSSLMCIVISTHSCPLRPRSMEFACWSIQTESLCFWELWAQWSIRTGHFSKWWE